MTVEIKVPALGESITEATVGQWLKKPGDKIEIDEPLVELETDKVTLEVPAPVSGVLSRIVAADGETVDVGAVLGAIADGIGVQTAAPEPVAIVTKSAPEELQPVAPATAEPELTPLKPADETQFERQRSPAVINTEMPPSPAARKAMAERGVSSSDVSGTGRRGQILKHDVATARASRPPEPGMPEPGKKGSEIATRASVPVMPVPSSQIRAPSMPIDASREQRVKMSRLRQTIARRLKDAQNTAAILTTFNDVDMSAVIELRNRYKESFQKRHDVKLGFMGFFVKACLQALKEIPAVNAEIDGGDLVYKNYYHIGVAVGTDKGLVVPVLHDADQLSIAQIESRINEFGERARDGKLGIQDMQGGTFTISNGGVYGSMLSTPILNAPQSGILGMHRIEDRPVAIDGQVVVRPMMYLALSYDHRVVDGKEAVTFLVRVKECLEDPQRFLLDL